MVEIEVVGRHALLFDDDGNANFVNSADALVEWNSLSIDRYDVRHLLSSPPPPRKRRLHRSSSSPPHPDASIEFDLDYERYLDLPSPSEEQGLDDGAEPANAGGYNAVGFSYGNPGESTEQKINDAEPAFHPSFPVPESLLQNLPPTEKLHQIIARTAMFVSKNGGQSEIVLRVKQGDNPMFGFLMPDHHLHPYFKFLVDHQELLKSDIVGKSLEEESKAVARLDVKGGAGSEALSLLGSAYGGGEDEDLTEDASGTTRSESVEAIKVNVSHGSEQLESSSHLGGTDAVVSKHLPPLKEKAPLIKKNRSIATVKAVTTTEAKKAGEVLGSSSTPMDKSDSSMAPNTSKVEAVVVEPPLDFKRVIDKIVEFILRNGKEFEGVLVEQDKNHGRFPFLLPSNKYHPYYLKVLQRAQESKLPGKGLSSEKHNSVGLRVDKKASQSKETDALSSGSAGHDIPYDSDKKEKFKMVLSKSKKDGGDPPPKTTQPEVGVSLDAAAAILQAATRGYKNPSLEILQRSLNAISQGPSREGAQTSSFGNLRSSQPHNSNDQNADPCITVPVAKAIAKTAAIAAASEADSSEAGMSKEQKLKAERLKRAKMFAAMIKNGAAPLRTESSRGVSLEPPDSGVSITGAEALNLLRKEREGSSVPLDVETAGKNEDKNIIGDEFGERKSKRKYRSKSEKHEEDDDIDQEEEELEMDHKHSKKRKSHRSSHHSRDKHKDRKRHSSKDRDSRHKHKHDRSSHDEHRSSRRRHKRHHSSDEEDHQPRRHKRNNSDDDDDDHERLRRKSISHKNRSHSERDLDLEEGEIGKVSENDVASREASVGLSNSCHDSRAPSQPPENTIVSDDFRAKIRAMLLTL